MNEPSPKPAFLVNADSDPVLLRVEGRASFQNSACVKEFISSLVARGKARFVMDFQACTGMDSTFLGVLAGAALEVRRAHPPGSLVLCRLGARNLELVRNLGLDRLLKVDAGDAPPAASGPATTLACTPVRDELENARLVLAAHENLIAADETNRARFQDVLTFLKARVTQG